MNALEEADKVEESSQGNVIVGLRLASSTSGEMISAAKSSTPSDPFGLPEDSSFQEDDELVDIPLDGLKLESPEKVWQDVYQSPQRHEKSKYAKNGKKGSSRNDQLPTLDDGLSSSQCSDSEHSESTEIFSDDEHGETETCQNELVEEDSGREKFASESSYPPCVPDLTESDIDSFMKKNQSLNIQPATVPDNTLETVWIKRNTVNVSDIDSELAFAQASSSERQNEDDYESGEATKSRSRMTMTNSASQEFDTDEETDELLEKQYQKVASAADDTFVKEPIVKEKHSSHSRVREGTMHDADSDKVLIEGVLFRANYLGSTQMSSHGLPTKMTRMMQAQEAVNRVKAPDGEYQPMSEVDLFISVEKIMVLNTNLQEILMDHCLRMISYIADIGDILVVMARRDPQVCSSGDDNGAASQRRMQNKICCHVFESPDARLIAQSIGHAFQVAYTDFLKANGIEEPGDLHEMDYQDVLNQQEMNIKELCLFSSKETQREVIVPKLKGEPLGVVIVESGWGSMLPTVVLANMNPTGPAARCNQLNVGFQLLSINGISLVGLPLTSCQSYIKAVRSQTVVKLSVVCCSPVIDVSIKRQDARFQLGFSVQNGVICSLLRGGIAERGGVRVGHKIIEINGESIVAVSHDKIVSLLANAVGEITMKTMLTSVYRLLIGQDIPTYI